MRGFLNAARRSEQVGDGENTGEEEITSRLADRGKGFTSTEDGEGRASPPPASPRLASGTRLAGGRDELRANGDKDGSFPGGGEGREVPFLRQRAKNLFLRSRERERSQDSGVALKQGEPLVIIPARGRESVAGVEIIASFPSPLLFGEHLRFRPWSNIKRQRNSKRAQTPF